MRTSLLPIPLLCSLGCIEHIPEYTEPQAAPQADPQAETQAEAQSNKGVVPPPSVRSDPCARCGPDQACIKGQCHFYLDIETRADSTCVVQASGEVACWGLYLSDTPTLVEDLHDAQRVAVGDGCYSCALREGGAVSCWRQPWPAPCPQLNALPLMRAVPIPLSAPARSISAGFAHGCAIQEVGKVECWGNNANGQLSPYRGATTEPTHNLPKTIVGISGARDLVSTNTTTCVSYNDGEDRLICWGHPAQALHETVLPGPARALDLWQTDLILEEALLVGFIAQDAIRAIRFSTSNEQLIAEARDLRTFKGRCLLDRSNTLRCRRAITIDGLHAADFWGRPVTSAEDYVIASGVSKVAIGLNHGCLLSTSGDVRCWGSNEDGELGIGQRNPTGYQEVTVSALPSDTEQLHADHRSACAITASGELWCWGWGHNRLASMGRLWSTEGALPLRVGAFPVRSASFGSFNNDAFTRISAFMVETSPSTHAVYRFGQRNLGPLEVPSPERIVYLDDATAISATWGEICGTLQDGSVRCVRGVEGTTSSVAVSDLRGATQLKHSPSGQLYGLVSGQAICVPMLGPPCAIDLSSLNDVHDLVVGGDFVCGIHTNQEVICAGLPGNTIGAGGMGGVVSGLSDVRALSASADHICAIDEGDEAYCWGLNQHLQIADVSGRISSPLKLSQRFESIAAGGTFTCGITLPSRNVVCWGQNSSCQLGRCPALVTETPTPIAASVPYVP